MSFNPFGTVTTYSKMLNKIASATFGAIVICLWLIKETTPSLRLLYNEHSLTVKLFDVDVPLALALTAFALTLPCRAFKLHDRLSDLFRIRHRFDVGEILLPMCAMVCAPMPYEFFERLKIRRATLMADVFYKYASSRAEKPAIDAHLIEMALDQWSWYWMTLETAFIFISASFVLLFLGSPILAFLLLVISIFEIALLVLLRAHCAKYALTEVREITLDPTRRAAIKAIFDAL